MGSIGICEINIYQESWEDDDWARNRRPFPTRRPYFGPKNCQNHIFSTIFLTTSSRTFKMGSIGIYDIDIHQDRWEVDDWDQPSNGTWPGIRVYDPV